MQLGVPLSHELMSKTKINEQTAHWGKVTFGKKIILRIEVKKITQMVVGKTARKAEVCFIEGFI